QKKASLEALDFIQNREKRIDANKVTVNQQRSMQDQGRFLIWAVTGAGKTEMIFPLIANTIQSGGLALIATPRRDVVLELVPRVKQAFPDCKVVSLYGGSKEIWEEGQITISTTHQLLRFQNRFDLAVIDEIDAFPYHNNPMLEFAVSKSCKRDGS